MSDPYCPHFDSDGRLWFTNPINNKDYPADESPFVEWHEGHQGCLEESDFRALDRIFVDLAKREGHEAPAGSV